MSGHDLQQIKVLLQARAPELARQLAPGGGAVRQGVYSPKNPTRADRKAGSFVIWVHGREPGCWKDYSTGDAGDVLELIRYCKGLADTRDAIAWAKDWLGLADMPREQRVRLARQAVQQKQQAARSEQAAEADKRRRAKAWWLKCAPIEGTVAELYLQGRGVDLAQLPAVPGALRYTPSCAHRPSDTTWPAIFSCMTGADGELQAVHRTYLTRDCTDKAPVEPQRMVWPSCAGAVIRLANGAGGKSPEAAERAGVRGELLVLCEGIEDGLSVVLAMPEARVWAVYSLSNLANVKLPRTVQRCVVWRDNDWGKPQAASQFERALSSLQRPGLLLSVASSSVGKDANDQLQLGDS